VNASLREHSAPVPSTPAEGGALRAFIGRHDRLFVLTGAGCSTESGIPDYRNAQGDWKRARPIMLETFLGDALARRRYWARSLAGWRRFRLARPNAAHHALARLQRAGRIECLVTQNVDGLHQAAGSPQVIDLHGRLDRVRCMQCGGSVPREAVQLELLRRNPAWEELDAPQAPDGDADLDHLDFSSFDVPPCARCGGILKPDVVFFGERVPPQRVAAAMQALERAAAMLVIGSSLMVYSGYRFADAAARAGKAIAAINLGRTRADELLTLKIEQPCAAALGGLGQICADAQVEPAVTSTMTSGVRSELA
jgi:NAD-dependent SIR2 family protein deacetylase